VGRERVALLLKLILKPSGYEAAWPLSWLIRMEAESNSTPFIYPRKISPVDPSLDQFVQLTNCSSTISEVDLRM